MAALSRLASSTHRQIEILPGDTVIIAAHAIPGNAKALARIIDQLYMLGAHVVYGAEHAPMHVSGHGSQEELKLMLTLMKPTFFVPIHGEYRMLFKHRQLAQATGVKAENIFIVSNGDTVEIDGRGARL